MICGSHGHRFTVLDIDICFYEFKLLFITSILSYADLSRHLYTNKYIPLVEKKREYAAFQFK